MTVNASTSVARACDDQSTVHLVFAMFEGLTEFCFVFRFGFRASLLDFTSRIDTFAITAQMYEVF